MSGKDEERLLKIGKDKREKRERKADGELRGGRWALLLYHLVRSGDHASQTIDGVWVGEAF